MLNTKACYTIKIVLMEHINFWSMLMILILILYKTFRPLNFCIENGVVTVIKHNIYELDNLFVG